MAATDPIDDDAVHVLQADETREGSGRLLLILAAVGLAAVAGAGVWLWLHPELLEGVGGAKSAAAPAAAPDNLLGAAWSFETTEAGSASQAWRVPEDAPSGFRFLPSGAVSGELGAVADPAVTSAVPGGSDDAARPDGGPDAASPAEAAGSEADGASKVGNASERAGRVEAGDSAAGWCRIVSDRAFALGAHRGAVALAATAKGDGVQLFLRFESEGRRPLDVVVAQGSGRIEGRALVPPGALSVRAGVQCAGNGSVDDVELRLTAAGDQALQRRGIFDVLSPGDGLLVFRGDQRVLCVSGLAAVDRAGALPPPDAGALSGELFLVLPDGRRLARRVEHGGDARRMTLRESVAEVPGNSTLVRLITVTGSLAEAPLGIASERGFEQFTGDFRVEGVRSLAFGHTQDRLALEFDRPQTLTGTRQPDGAVLVRAESAGAGSVSQELAVQTSFQEERVAAAQHRDAALAAEQAGRLGAALAEAELIVTRYPHDEDVLAQAQALRSRVQGVMQQRLDVIDGGLADALFLDSASRCREVLADCTAAAETFEGSDGAARFRERAQTVSERAADLLAEDRGRRVYRLTAIMESFRAAGGYDGVAGEIEDTLARFLQPPGEAPPAAGER